MLGAIIGDMVGSRFEGPNKHPTRVNFKMFPTDTYFTDDTVLTVAVADAILNNKPYTDVIREYYRKYPYAGYGKAFKAWGKADTKEGYNSFGNGSAMRVSPIAFAFDTKEQVMEQAKISAEATHNHPDGIKGAQAIAYATFLARMGADKKQIRDAMENEMGYDLLNLKKGFDSSCNGSVPNAIVAFLNSDSFVDAIRGAILMGGDSDTIACMAGSIAQPYYGAKLGGIPPNLVRKAFKRLPEDLASITVEFVKKYVDTNFVRSATMAKNAQLYDLFRSIFKS
jgi:ADP-ribosylglycohydrolase